MGMPAPNAFTFFLAAAEDSNTGLTESLERFSLFGLLLFDPFYHSEFAHRLETDLDWLDFASGQSFLFIANLNPPERLKRILELRDYYQEFRDVLEDPNGAFFLRSHDQSLTSWTLANLLEIPAERLPAIIVVSRLTDSRFAVVSTGIGSLREHLSYLGYVAERTKGEGDHRDLIREVAEDERLGAPGLQTVDETLSRSLAGVIASVESMVVLRDAPHSVSQLARPVARDLANRYKSIFVRAQEEGNYDRIKHTAVGHSLLSSEMKKLDDPATQLTHLRFKLTGLAEPFWFERATSDRVGRLIRRIVGGGHRPRPVASLGDGIESFVEPSSWIAIRSSSVVESAFGLLLPQREVAAQNEIRSVLAEAESLKRGAIDLSQKLESADHLDLTEEGFREFASLMGDLERITAELKDCVVNIPSDQEPFDWSAFVICLASSFENEVNLSIVHWARAELGIDLPPYFAKLQPDIEAMVLPPWGNATPINFNNGKGTAWYAPTLGQSEIGIKCLLESAKPPRWATDLGTILMHEWKLIVKQRNQAAHPGIVTMSQAYKTKVSFARLVENGIFQWLTHMKSMYRGDTARVARQRNAL